MKKTILLFTSAVLLSMASVYAQGGTTGPLTWEINNGTLTISGEGEMPDYPYAITPWYDYKNDIHTLIIESGVSSIGSLAFGDLKNLTSVSIANTVLTLREGAFFRCTTLPSINIPDGLITIKTYTFRDCSSLNSIILSKTVEEIDLSAFGGCSGLTSIEVANANTNFASENGVLFNKDKTILLRYPEGKSGAYIIPNNVVTIGSFGSCTKLTSLTIPNSVTAIGNGAFSGCTSLTSITIPNSVKSIGASAFINCTNLTSVTISSSVTNIEWGTFYNCTNLTSVTIPNGIVSIGGSTFFNCTNLTSVTIPSSLTSIGSQEFAMCKNLKLITNYNPVPVNIDIYREVFLGVNYSACTLEVPMGSVSAYKEAEVWKLFNIVGINVGIVETDNYPSLRVYPNPTTGELTIDNGQLTIDNVEIFDVYGKKLSPHHLITSSSNHLIISSSNHQINISHLPAGIYFVKVYTEQGVFVEKVIKN